MIAIFGTANVISRQPAPIYRVFHKKTAPFIFDYNSYENGPICVKFAANV